MKTERRAITVYVSAELILARRPESANATIGRVVEAASRELARHGYRSATTEIEPDDCTDRVRVTVHGVRDALPYRPPRQRDRRLPRRLKSSAL